MSEKSDKKSKGKAEKGAKDKKDKKKGKGSAEAGTVISIANHPRASASVRRTKAAVGLAAFVLTVLLSKQAGVPLAQAAERGLLIGIAGYLVAWACAVMIWRAIVLAELKAYADSVRSRQEETVAVASAAAAAAAARKQQA